MSVCLGQTSSETAKQIWLKVCTRLVVSPGHRISHFGDASGVLPGEPKTYRGGDIVSVLQLVYNKKKLIELVLNYDGVHTTNGIICRRFDVTAEIVLLDFCGIFAIWRRGAAWFCSSPI